MIHFINAQVQVINPYNFMVKHLHLLSVSVSTLTD